jgi:hypothetical protein
MAGGPEPGDVVLPGQLVIGFTRRKATSPSCSVESETGPPRDAMKAASERRFHGSTLREDSRSEDRSDRDQGDRPGRKTRKRESSDP